MAVISMGSNHRALFARYEQVGAHLVDEAARLEAELRYVLAQRARLDAELAALLQQGYNLDPRHVPITIDSLSGQIITPDSTPNSEPVADEPTPEPEPTAGVE